VIMDFGLSRAQDSEARMRTSEQLQGAGTLPYMAIEQLECRPTLGPPADVYAFGVVLYEMLTGRLPFDGDSLGAILLKQLRERPPAPSSVVPRLNPELDAFVLKCLSQDPRQRFPSAGQALAALSDIEPWQVRARPRRWLALAALALLLAAFALIASVGERQETLSNLPAPPAAESTQQAHATKEPAREEIPTSVQAAPPAPSATAPPAPSIAASGESAAAPVKPARRHEPPARKAPAPAASSAPGPQPSASGSSAAPANWPALPPLVPIESVPLPPAATRRAEATKSAEAQRAAESKSSPDSAN
jgi:serine/threonine protein kinase